MQIQAAAGPMRSLQKLPEVEVDVQKQGCCMPPNSLRSEPTSVYSGFGQPALAQLPFASFMRGKVTWRPWKGNLRELADSWTQELRAGNSLNGADILLGRWGAAAWGGGGSCQWTWDSS